jgi:hypothetical protein
MRKSTQITIALVVALALFYATYTLFPLHTTAL